VQAHISIDMGLHLALKIKTLHNQEIIFLDFLVFYSKICCIFVAEFYVDKGRTDEI
jgi:hypothetical protein